MKGLGVFSPNPANSRCILVAPGFDESCGLSSPRSNVGDKFLTLLEFDIKERVEQPTNSLTSQFDSFSNFNNYGYQNSIASQNWEFESYMSSNTGSGIADFHQIHTCPLEFDGGNITSLKWMNCGDQEGIVAIGSINGDVTLLNGADLLAAKPKCKIISNIKVCNTPIKCLSFNAKTNTLGVAGIDGQVSSVDLTSTTEPKVVDISFGKWRVGMVTGLSWNNRLGHILATSGSSSMQSGSMSPSDSTGLVVWDLKVRKPASSFRDPNGRINPVGIEWLPDQLTQLVVAYGDDKSPAIQLWDLRNCSVPLKEIKGHTRGVTSLGFSPHDPSLLLTSGRDDFTRCWSMSHSQGPFYCVSNIQTGALSHHKRIEWHPTFPGLFLGQDTDDDNALLQVFDHSQSESYMPSWVCPMRGVTSGFGGAIHTWNAAGDVRSFNLKSNLEPGTMNTLVESLDILQKLTNNANYSSVCKAQIESNWDSSPLVWKTMDALYLQDSKLLAKCLGYAPMEPQPEPVPAVKVPQEAIENEVDGEEFFNTLREKGAESFCQQPPEPQDPNTLTTPDSKLASPQNTSWGDDKQRSNVVLGNFPEAARQALKRNNIAEALLLAYAGGPDLWLEISQEVTRKANDPFIRTVFHLMQGDIGAIVANSDLGDWRETLSCICNIYSTNRPEFQELAGKLADRLFDSYARGDSKHLVAASVAYLCSSNVPKILETWRLLQDDHGSLDTKARLLVRCTALASIMRHPSLSDVIGMNATLVAEALVEAGEIGKALDCLEIPIIKSAPHASAFASRIQAHTSQAPRFVQQSAPISVAPATPIVAHGTVPSVPTQVAAPMVQNPPSVVSRSVGVPTMPQIGSAPTAVAGAMYPGMPVPWPLPTETQQKVSNTKSTQEANRRIIATSAAPSITPRDLMPQKDLQFCTNVLTSLVPQGDTSRMAQETQRRIDELVSILQNGQLDADANGLILNMCSAIHAGDRSNANILLSNISTKLWNIQNKGWIMCLKRIVPN
ncbi:bifunctional Protein transport protein SEC31-like/WD40-YVTN repeat-like-containing domain superfamily/WD40-repeat-containing domain superfamily/WD40 repeat [Babesia duncani]|uniref:Bifunctional Protein transport protein SEC31-like/WD40-YVTN repeat-like-containing domain superfamily/WD40-repeat-containing domain superfamily/WD40 repeat n=1 Tax=Babesia duncani TaxID=323732 RepID=A0AAD9UP89_9APIC|nr:bifunctional Protein transport protein SEC31-like/WD40-YVTN repeat-like-containing domain superfamily/WD40-repeat-containing domain superfamily/WD40 repeat [Babesia duncani]